MKVVPWSAHAGLLLERPIVAGGQRPWSRHAGLLLILIVPSILFLILIFILVLLFFSEPAGLVREFRWGNNYDLFVMFGQSVKHE